MMTIPKKRLISGINGLAAQGGKDFFRIFSRHFEIQGVRAKINFVEPDKLAK